MRNKAPNERTNVQKVVIVPYKDKNFQNQDRGIEQFVVPVNPESYGENIKVEYDQEKGVGNEGTGGKYKGAPPAELKMDFTLDGTGTIQGYYYNDLSVLDQVEKLKKVVYNKKSDKHRPNFCIVFWGDLAFQCVMTSLDIKYTLFDEDGRPLRAKTSAAFSEYIAKEEREARANENSPDLTHMRKATSSDRLDLLTHEIYNESNLLLQVAKANGLTSLRKLRAGAEIFFPPLDKTEL